MASNNQFNVHGVPTVMQTWENINEIQRQWFHDLFLLDLILMQLINEGDQLKLRGKGDVLMPLNFLRRQEKVNEIITLYKAEYAKARAFKKKMLDLGDKKYTEVMESLWSKKTPDFNTLAAMTEEDRQDTVVKWKEGEIFVFKWRYMIHELQAEWVQVKAGVNQRIDYFSQLIKTVLTHSGK